MGLKQEESISRYFAHAMSPGEEQNFLISLAASDQMRIAFRSHLELMKAVREDKDDLRSVAQVRTRTLAALGISAAAATPFIEQELLRSAKSEPAASATSTPIQPSSWLSRIATGFRTGKLALGTGLALGFSTAILVVNLSSDAPHQSSATAPKPATILQTIPSSPATQASQSDRVSASQKTVSTPIDVKSLGNETIPASKDLHNVARSSDERSSSRSVNPTGRTHEAASLTSTTKSSATPPVLSTSRRGRMEVKPIKISSPSDEQSSDSGAK